MEVEDRMNSFREDIIYQYPSAQAGTYVFVVPPTAGVEWELFGGWVNTYIVGNTIIRMLHLSIVKHYLGYRRIELIADEKHHPAMSLTPARNELMGYYKVRWDEWHMRMGYLSDDRADYRACLEQFVPRIVQERLQHHTGVKFSRIDKIEARS